MKVSVIIPLYNAGDVIEETIKSVLAQTWKDYEIVVVDDGSTDESGKVIQQFCKSLRYIRQENAGVASARNRGIAESCGENVALLDHDDLWHPTKLEKQVRILEVQPAIGMVITDVAHIDRYGYSLGHIGAGYNPEEEFSRLFLQGFVPTPSAAMIRQSVFKSVGMFDESFSSAGLDDHELWVRIAEHCAIYNIQEPLTYHRNREEKSPQIELDHRSILLSKLEKRYSNDPEKHRYLIRQRISYLAALGKWLISEGKPSEGRSYLYQGLLLSLRRSSCLNMVWRCLTRIIRSYG